MLAITLSNQTEISSLSALRNKLISSRAAGSASAAVVL
jgi:hypothetical protein